MQNSRKLDEVGEGAAIEQLKEDLRREHEMYLRALADFDNYRRRVERERADSARGGKREVLRSLLDVLDGFERALQHAADTPVSGGLQAIQRQFLDLLEAHGVIPFDSLGQSFDPALHEAIGSVEGSPYPPGAIAEELQRGYRWGDELLRPARVQVAK